MTEVKPETPELEKELASLLNRHSLENGSNTPDFILAHYLLRCLDTFNTVILMRKSWYGKDDKR